MTAKQDADAGAWSGDDMQQTIQQTRPELGGDANFPASTRFVSSVAKALKQRIGALKGKSDPKTLAVFILDAKRCRNGDGTSKRALINASQPLVGRLWYMNEVATTAQWIPLSGSTIDDASALASTKGVENLPTVIYDPGGVPQRLLLFENGLAAFEQAFETVFETESITVDDILDVIDRLHKRSLITSTLRTPNAKLWQNGEAYIPVPSTEAEIQRDVCIALQEAYPGCFPRAEGVVKSGRFDICLEENLKWAAATSVVKNHAILELKVLRSFGSTGKVCSAPKNLKAMVEGVGQARQYRDDKPADLGLLCCFDMRSNHTVKVPDEVVKLASAESITVKIWIIFSTSLRLREYRSKNGDDIFV